MRDNAAGRRQSLHGFEGHWLLAALRVPVCLRMQRALWWLPPLGVATHDIPSSFSHLTHGPQGNNE